MFDPSHCRSCTRPLRLYAQFHHDSTLFRKRWKSRCAVCEWKASNPEVSRIDAFRLWPPKLDIEQWGRVTQFLCQEGKDVIIWPAPRRVLFASPHLQCLHTTAIRRTWHSVLLTGLDWADDILWNRPELLENIYVSGIHSRTKNERAAWALLSVLCKNPIWLLVASCCPASVRNRAPACGRPMQVLLAFLGGPRGDSGPRWLSLDQGCNPLHSSVRVTAGEANEAFVGRPAFQRWAGRGRYASLPWPTPADRAFDHSTRD